MFNETAGGTENGYSLRYITEQWLIGDAINTVEAVFLPPGTFAAGQSLTIRVFAASTVQGPQLFSVYGYNVN